MNELTRAELTIPSRYNGPPDSGNGGYCCGRFAQLLEVDPLQAMEVTLRAPPPLERPLSALVGDGCLEVRDGATLVASVCPATLDIGPLPAAPETQAAREAEQRYTGFASHPFDACFVCGPRRTVGDGLRLFPGLIASTCQNQAVACHWQPYSALADPQGNIRPEFIWAALDCPTYFGAFAETGRNPVAVLGRQSVRLLQAHLSADRGYLIQSWLIVQEGRKYHSAGVLYSEDGNCLALCRATWIELK